MHGFYKKLERLRRKIETFKQPLQFRLENKQFIFHGGIGGWEMPNSNEYRIILHFDWLCECRPKVGSGVNSFDSWSSFKISNACFDLCYTSYYFQRKRAGVRNRSDREARIKIKTVYNEILHIYEADDPDCLVIHNEVYISRSKVPKPLPPKIEVTT